MKKILVLLSFFLGTYSAHATVVAEDTAEHTINFTFGRPTANVYLCRIRMAGLPQNDSFLNTMTFPNGASINMNPNGYEVFINFERDNSPLSSTLSLGSAKYGVSVMFFFCHDLQIPFENPGGEINTFYKIQTPSTWSYFANANVLAGVVQECPGSEPYIGTPFFALSSNGATDYTLLTSIPFANGDGLGNDTLFNCATVVQIREDSQSPRTPGETAGNITVGVKDQINFN